jgi:DNA transposition AAA+ family ATPase
MPPALTTVPSENALYNDHFPLLLITKKQEDMITEELQKKIALAISVARHNYPSDAKHAASLGISTGAYSSIKSGSTAKILSEASWLMIARKLDVNLREKMEWKAAETPVFQFVTAQLEACQQSGLSALLCDLPNIGKTFTAKHYARTHSNVVYVDCSQVKSRRQLVCYIAAEFGLNAAGRYKDVYQNLVYYIDSIYTPLIILDEAGDLSYEAFLELKALWNATEHRCGWYMMGADGLHEKIKTNIDNKKVGYTELYSRFGNCYNRVTPEDGKDRTAFLKGQAHIVATVNLPAGTDVESIVRLSEGGLRRVYTEVEKIKGGMNG